MIPDKDHCGLTCAGGSERRECSCLGPNDCLNSLKCTHRSVTDFFDTPTHRFQQCRKCCELIAIVALNPFVTNWSAVRDIQALQAKKNRGVEETPVQFEALRFDPDGLT